MDSFDWIILCERLVISEPAQWQDNCHRESRIGFEFIDFLSGSSVDVAQRNSLFKQNILQHYTFTDLKHIWNLRWNWNELQLMYIFEKITLNLTEINITVNEGFEFCIIIAK